MADPWRCGDNDKAKSDQNSSSGQFEDNFSPQQRIPDSATYLASLESKLSRLKGKTREPTARDMLSTLQQVREDHMNHLVDSNYNMFQEASSFLSEVENGDKSTSSSFLERRLFPDKHALTMEELQNLLEADVLAKTTAEMTPSDGNSTSQRSVER